MKAKKREPLFLSRGEAWVLVTAICVSARFAVIEEFSVTSVIKAGKVLKRLANAFSFGDVKVCDESIETSGLHRGDDSQDVRPLTPVFLSRKEADVLASLIFAAVCCTGGPEAGTPQLADLRSVIEKIEGKFDVGINSQDLELEG